MTAEGLLLTSAGVRGRNVARACRSAGVELKVVTTPGDLSAALDDELDFVVVDAGDDLTDEQCHEAFLGLEGTALSRRAILLSDLTMREAFISLLEGDLLHHVIASSTPGALDRLTLTLATLVSEEPIAVQRYLPWGTQIHGFVLTRSETKWDVLGRLADYAEHMGIPSRLATLARSVGDELLMNAMYDAPVDANGRHLFAHTPRNEPVELPAHHEVRFRFCATAGSLVVSVRDSFGSLDPDSVRSNLLRTLSGGDDQIRSGTTGAGVGLYMVFRALSDWIIDVRPGRTTEMIGMIRTSGTYRDHIAMPKSFHLFGGSE